MKHSAVLCGQLAWSSVLEVLKVIYRHKVAKSEVK